jgi:pyruvate ferredoxin oxidoreductase gamma subunit
MLLAKNLATVKHAYEIATEWAEKNHVELKVGTPVAA